jgi:hypothetical protein
MDFTCSTFHMDCSPRHVCCCRLPHTGHGMRIGQKQLDLVFPYGYLYPNMIQRVKRRCISGSNVKLGSSQHYRYSDWAPSIIFQIMHSDLNMHVSRQANMYMVLMDVKERWVWITCWYQQRRGVYCRFDPSHEERCKELSWCVRACCGLFFACLENISISVVLVPAGSRQT